MKISSLILSLLLPGFSMATSPMGPVAEDLYCQQVQTPNGSMPGFQLQVSTEFKGIDREVFVAVKYDSSIIPVNNFSGSQTFDAKFINKTNTDILQGILTTGENYTSTSIASHFSAGLEDVKAYQAYYLSPKSRFTDVRIHTNGPGAKSVILRFIQTGEAIDIAVLGLSSRELSLKELLKKDEENYAQNKNRVSNVYAHFNVYNREVKCTTEGRYSHVRPNLIK